MLAGGCLAATAFSMGTVFWPSAGAALARSEGGFPQGSPQIAGTSAGGLAQPLRAGAGRGRRADRFSGGGWQVTAPSQLSSASFSLGGAIIAGCYCFASGAAFSLIMTIFFYSSGGVSPLIARGRVPFFSQKRKAPKKLLGSGEYFGPSLRSAWGMCYRSPCQATI